jgi:GNAT superfamily N-acetyltransferase
MLELRLTRDEEASLVRSLIQRGFAETREFADPSSALGESEEDVRRELARGAALVAELDGEPVAVVRFFIEPKGGGQTVDRALIERARRGETVPSLLEGGQLVLSRLTVVPEARGRGIAQQLLGELERIAAQLGVRRLAITVRSQQPDNRPFWQSLGFRITGYSERYGIADMVTHMEKPCAQHG